MSFIPIHNHTCWSLLESSVLIKDFAKKCSDLSVPAACLTEHHNLKSVVSFCREMNSVGVKPIIGCEINIYKSDTEYSRVTLIAKNYSGYKNLVRLVSVGNERSNIINPENFSCGPTPTVKWDDIREHSGNLICLIGDLNSDLVKSCFTKHSLAYRCNSLDSCREYVDRKWSQNMESVISEYAQIFEDVFTFYDKSTLPILEAFEKMLIKKTDGKCLPSRNVHYLNKSDFEIHKMVLKTQSDMSKYSGDNEFFSDNRIFYTDEPCCFLDESLEGKELTLDLLELIDDYSIEQRPILPKFKIKGHTVKDADETLRENCRSGFKDLDLLNKVDKGVLPKYFSRVKHELSVFEKAGISSYFLIVQDLMNYCRDLGVPADVRGSSSGCMISYLLGISSIDPMNPDPTISYSEERELPFERFYNEGRNTKGNVSLADIDIDVPPSFRERLIKHIKEKYGRDCVGHIITHSKFKGKGALKEVFRLTKPVSNYFDVANEITKVMIDEAKISDELNEKQQDNPGYGIIQWNIDNVPAFSNFYETYKETFDIAIKLEQIPKNESVHAAGIIIADQPLKNLFPLRYSAKLDELVIDIEGSDIESLGGVKFDILGVAAIEKLYHISMMVNSGSLSCEFGMDIEDGE